MKGPLRARLVVERPDGFVLDVDLSVDLGRTVALLGPNGAGKSTVVAAIAGLVQVDDGTVVLGDTVLDDPAAGVFVDPADRRVGVVFQRLLLFPHLDALENVAFGLRSRGVARAEARHRAAHWLERVGIADLGRRRPDSLSGGQAQRVALARALATEPDLLLLDEPLSALDATTRVELRRMLAEHLSGFAGPRLLITHDPVEAFSLADEVIVVEDGRVTQVGTPDDIRLRPRTPYAADLGGVNLFVGTATRGIVDTGTLGLHIADTTVDGPVLLTVAPRSVSFHLRPPEGSPRNVWQSTIDSVERLGEIVRIGTGGPLSVVGDVTPGSVAELGLVPGALVWVSIKATEIGVDVG